MQRHLCRITDAKSLVLPMLVPRILLVSLYIKQKCGTPHPSELWNCMNCRMVSVCCKKKNTAFLKQHILTPHPIRKQKHRVLSGAKETPGSSASGVISQMDVSSSVVNRNTAMQIYILMRGKSQHNFPLQPFCKLIDTDIARKALYKSPNCLNFFFQLL